jgi:hypothetical protein
MPVRLTQQQQHLQENDPDKGPHLAGDDRATLKPRYGVRLCKSREERALAD